MASSGASYSGNVVSAGAGFSIPSNNSWNAMGLDVMNMFNFKTAAVQNNDTLYLIIDGNSWYLYYNNNTLTPDLSLNADLGPHNADMTNLGVMANTGNGLTTDASVTMEVLVTKSEMLAAGLDPSNLLAGTQTLCDETF